jgi:hypothetical protein
MQNIFGETKETHWNMEHNESATKITCERSKVQSWDKKADNHGKGGEKQNSGERCHCHVIAS